ncbi:DUF6471 domain-containing protein [Delftia sp.]|uniref:DUF6471 domain-containing protein n=1 Tax=Delftia sp. TaxID=1886637 RepID=UPI00257BA1B0|nr:DUF6471 domain-containing protein [Delftia sp.]
MLFAAYTPLATKMHRMQGRSIDADVTMRPKSAVEKEWEAEAKQLLKAELARQGVTYRELVNKLEILGIKDDEKAIGNRISRGKFTLVFFLQCMRAIGVQQLDLRDRTRSRL